MSMKGVIGYKYTVMRKRVMPLILVSFIILFSSMCVLVLADDPQPPGQPYSMTVTANPEYLSINGNNVTITATVYDESGNFSTDTKVYFNNSETNLGLLSGGTYTYIIDWGWYEWINYTNDTGVATITLTPGATMGTEKIRVWIGSDPPSRLNKTVTVEITAEDEAPPSVTNPSAIPDVILNDNGRGRAEGTNVSRINVTVTDDAGVASVTIDLSPINGSATQPMELIDGTNINGIWSVTTAATAGINNTHSFVVNATDFYEKFNDTVSVPLEVLRRGDVVRDNVTDMKDMLYIARYTVGYEPEVSNPPSVFVGDVVGDAGDPNGDGKADMKDALYIARWAAGQEEEP